MTEIPTRIVDEEFLQCCDAAREADVTPAAINWAARKGLLRVATTTPTGTRLYRRADVREYSKRACGRRRRKAGCAMIASSGGAQQ